MKWRNKSGRFIVFIMFFVGCLSLSIGALAAPPDGKGGRKPTNPGGTKKGDLMADLWVVVRDVGEGDGAPIKFDWTWAAACYDESGEFDATRENCSPISATPGVQGGCVQPISLEPVGALDPQFVYSDYVNSYGESPDVYLIPLDPECKIPVGFEESWGEQAVEVESGRLNMARTSTYVLEAAYAEALANINSAISVALDPAGRLLLTLLEGAETYEKVVDSPRENLALYQTLMLGIKNGGEGCLPGINAEVLAADLTHLVCGATEDGYALDLQRAAAFLAGAADKFGSVGIDEVVYLNSFLGINNVVKNPADGSLLVTGYFDFTDAFVYDRVGVYQDVSADLLQPPANPTVYPDTFDVVYDLNVYDKIFGEGWDGQDYPYPVVNFARAVDDAVGVIFYIHNYELPECIECLEGEQLP